MKPILTKTQFYSQLGEEIKQHRLDAKISQRQLAKLINRHSTRICVLELGTTPIGLKIIYDIAQVLHLDIHFYLKDKSTYEVQGKPNKDIFKQIGSQIKNARIQAGKSETETAKVLGHSNRNIIALIEDGQLPITINSVLKLADWLNLDLFFNLVKREMPKQKAKPRIRQNKILVIKNYDDFIGKISLEISRLRQLLGLRQSDLAEMAGFFGRGAIASIEAGKVGLTFNSINRLAKAFDAKLIFAFKKKNSKITTSPKPIRIPLPEHVSNEILRLRTEMQLSQMNFAKRIGLKSIRGISEIECHKKNLSIRSFMSILEALDLELVFSFQR